MCLSDDLKKLIENLPSFIQIALETKINKKQIIEIVLDLGRRPEIRFVSGPEYLSPKIISWQDIDLIVKRVNKFNTENRAGFEKTLHRISCIRNRQFLIIGLTCRVGRSITGTISAIQDLLELNKSILLLGPPGIGKTTIIREIGRVLADEMKKRVIIIDTSNEIAGDGNITNLGIGRARRMQVSNPELQHEVMIEAVENHTPEIIIIDEIGNELEVMAAQTIAEKGVQLIGTTHGYSLNSLIKNPILVNLIGGIQYVILSDEEAKRRKTNKSIIERKFLPPFDVLVEITYNNYWFIHENIKNSIDILLSNSSIISQLRSFNLNTETKIKLIDKQSFTISIFNERKMFLNVQRIINNNWNQINKTPNTSLNSFSFKPVFIYSYCLSSNFVKETFTKTGVTFFITKNINEATLIIGLKKSLKVNFQLKKLARIKKIPIYSLTDISYYQLIKLIHQLK